MEKKIFIVGMGEGISMGVVIRFANEGYKPVMFARNIETLDGLRKILANENIEAEVYQMDSSDQETIINSLELAVEEQGVPEVFIYNAANIRKTCILKETFDSLIHDFKVNVAGAVISASFMVDKMKQYGKGSIIFTGGGLSMYPNNEYGSLSIGKAGIKNLTQSMAQAVENTGVKIGTVTICGFVSKEDKMYNPTSIAEQYWKLHSTMSNGSDIDY
ncbi:MAG: oxidoreductase [Melioribacteraceae bacterium]|nr:MAG: oxidoreductase [Melioribacteraceae bacterium]